MSLQKRDIWKDDAEPLLLEQYKAAERFKAVIEATSDYLSQIESVAFEIGGTFDISDGNYTRAKLEYIGGLFNVPRNPGETDREYRDRLLLSIRSKDAGTPEYLIRTARNISGDKAPQYLDELPAICFIYTPAGRQLTRDQVAKRTPAGVLGLPGAAIETAEGDFIHLSGETRIRLICAAQDVTPTPTGEWLLDENGDPLLTENGEEIELESPEEGEDVLTEEGERLLTEAGENIIAESA